jgi:hypothetical protein
VLRAEIDALDRDLLHTAARRMALVAEVAAYKRAHGLRVRDAARERELLADRGGAPPPRPAGRRDGVGVPGAHAASRDRRPRSARGAAGDRPRTVAVVGGRGGIGRVMARLFATSATGARRRPRHRLRPADAAAAPT